MPKEKPEELGWNGTQGLEKEKGFWNQSDVRKNSSSNIVCQVTISKLLNLFNLISSFKMRMITPTFRIILKIRVTVCLSWSRPSINGCYISSHGDDDDDDGEEEE